MPSMMDRAAPCDDAGRSARVAAIPAEVVLMAGSSPVKVFFLSDSTGISAETMGNALLLQFPDLVFERTLIPFITTVAEAREVVARLDAAVDAGPAPLVFSTTAVTEIRDELHRTRAGVIDFFDLHVQRVEQVLGVTAARAAGRLHGMGDAQRYNDRMAAVEFAIEHDDGQSLRALDKADVVLLAPSRCGKTPTTMYLALQHGLFVANYPLVDDDFTTDALPEPVRAVADRCFGIVTTPARLAEVRQQRRANSTYSSLETCTRELRRARAIFEAHGVPTVNSATRSVEEMSAVILQQLVRRGLSPARQRP